MEYLIEFILDIVLESSIEASKNNKVPKLIRYLLLIFIIFFFITVIGLIYLTAFLMLKENIICFILFFILATFLFILSIIKFKKIYIQKIINRIYLV